MRIRFALQGSPPPEGRDPEKTDAAGRHVRQIELCPLHCQIVVERERSRRLEIRARRNE